MKRAKLRSTSRWAAPLIVAIVLGKPLDLGLKSLRFTVIVAHLYPLRSHVSLIIGIDGTRDRNPFCDGKPITLHNGALIRQ
jgi:hypothetical protein